MTIVEIRGGPLTYRSLMNWSKDRLASEVLRLTRAATEAPRIDCDEQGLDDLWLPDVGLHLERMSDGQFWQKVGPHVVVLSTRRGALIRAVYRNEDTGREAGHEARPR